MSFSSSNNTSSHQSGEISVCGGRFYAPIHGPLMFLCLLIMIANMFVIALVQWKENLRTLSNLILASLAVSDLMSGLFGASLSLSCSLSFALGPCVSSALFSRFTAISSVLHLFLVACDRYAMIVFAIHYPSIVTKWRVVCALVCIWLLSVGYTATQLSWYNFGGDLGPVKEEDEIYFSVFLVFFFALPLFSMFSMYGHIFAVSLRHVLAARKRHTNLGNRSTNSVARRLRGTAVLMSMLLIFSGCWLPFFLLSFQDHIETKLLPVRSWSLCLFLFQRFFPPLANPILCAFCKRDFRQAWRAKTITCRITCSFNDKVSEGRKKCFLVALPAKIRGSVDDAVTKSQTTTTELSKVTS